MCSPSFQEKILLYMSVRRMDSGILMCRYMGLASCFLCGIEVIHVLHLTMHTCIIEGSTRGRRPPVFFGSIPISVDFVIACRFVSFPFVVCYFCPRVVVRSVVSVRLMDDVLIPRGDSARFRNCISTKSNRK